MISQVRQLLRSLRRRSKSAKPTLRWTKVEAVPARVSPGIVYLVGDDEVSWDAVLICPCGCGDLIRLSLVPGREAFWRVIKHRDKTISLKPSVWRTVRCRSHFWLNRSRIVWVPNLVSGINTKR